MNPPNQPGGWFERQRPPVSLDQYIDVLVDSLDSPTPRAKRATLRGREAQLILDPLVAAEDFATLGLPAARRGVDLMDVVGAGERENPESERRSTELHVLRYPRDGLYVAMVVEVGAACAILENPAMDPKEVALELEDKAVAALTPSEALAQGETFGRGRVLTVDGSPRYCGTEVLRDPSVSKRQFHLIFDSDGSLLVEDLKSINGTSVTCATSNDQY